MHFFLGLSFIEDPDKHTFPFLTDGIPLTVDIVFLSSWPSNMPSGGSLRTWLTVPDTYLQWINRIQAAYEDLWKEIGIFDTIQLSRNAYQADHLLLASALYFWSPRSNTFFFLSDTFTPILIDVAVIIDLPPYGAIISSTFIAEGIDKFDSSLDLKANLAYGKFHKLFIGQGPNRVTKEEHTVFLLYWLCHSLFCIWSQKITRDFVPIVVALANDQNLLLALTFWPFCTKSSLKPLSHFLRRKIGL